MTTAISVGLAATTRAGTPSKVTTFASAAAANPAPRIRTRSPATPRAGSKETTSGTRPR